MPRLLNGRPDDLRGGRLRNLFAKVLSGEQSLTSLPSAKLFIEAICDQLDQAQCLEKLISSPRGLDALQSSLRFDISPEFINTSATSLLRYLQAPELQIICGGEFLRHIILRIADPPIFWNAIVKAQNTYHLNDEALQSFSWLLLQLISLPADKASTYYVIAKDASVQKALLHSSQLEVRTLGQKIKHVIDITGVPDQFDGDGPGGRHDNDFADIRRIAILPTADELASTEDPFLRRATEIDECNDEDRLSVHIDNQFRLSRDDMLRDLREELQIARGLKKGRRRGMVIDGLVIDGIDCDNRQPWSLRLQCLNDLPQLPQTTYDKRKKFVTENRNFIRHQSLTCLIADGQVAALLTINRNEELLAHNPPILCLWFSEGKESILKGLLSLKSAEHIQLVQLNTAVFAYEPVLRQLQNMKQLPLTDEIMLWKEGKSLETANMSKTRPIIHLVEALRADPSCNLQDKLDLPKPIRLDESQAECLLAGLTQCVSLVQGPPGTGKSFIGALQAKIIHDCSSQTILVVCYTNHALDQFLEDLLKIDIPAESIVRLGSAAKSTATTQSLTLSNQNIDFKLKKDDWNLINRRKLEAAEEAIRLRDAFSEYNAKAVSKSALMEYLEFDPDNLQFYDAFILPDDGDGMVKIGQKGKAIDKFYLLERWCRGLDAGNFKSGVEREFPGVWQMDPAKRLAALKTWKSDILEERIWKVYNCGLQFNETLTHISALFNEKDRQILRKKRIIGCTTTAAAKYVQSIQSASPGVLLVEEAGEILESHILTALGPKTQQLILIGDHKQLRPKAHFDLSIEKGEGYDLNRSLFERLVLKRFPHQVLSQQHRMRPEISSLVRSLTYPGLTDAPSTKSRPHLRGFQDELVFLDHEAPEDELRDVPDWKDGNSTSTKQNHFEAMMTLKCVRYLGQQGYGTDQLVVLTPYLGQLRHLVDVLGKENDPVLNDLDSYDLVRAGLVAAATAQVQKRKLRISTIDNYQGEESDIVIISLTRSNARGDIGFLSSPERLNVLLSRARNGLIMIGNTKTFLESRKGGELWAKLMGLLKEGSHIYDGFPVKCEQHPDRRSLLRQPKDFDECPDGGCNEPCNVTLKCGVHLCPQRCHQLFDHSKMACDHLVQAKCPVGHVQSWKCHASRPTTCRACEKKQQVEEKKLQREFDRQQKRDLEQREHDAQMAKLNEEIRRLRETMVDGQKRKEMAQALEQLKQDLEDVSRLAMQSSKPAPQPTELPVSSTSRSSGLSKTDTSAKQNPTRGREVENTACQDKLEQSPSGIEWERQKGVENASNDAMDALMEMTGLEEVKAQFLRIKARIDTSIRQSIDLRNDRFGIVLLGNPGTGKTTVARLYAKFLTSLSILPGSEFVESTGSHLANDGVAGARKHIETILNAGGGAFFLDEAYQLALGHNYGGTSVLDYLLAEIENQVGKIVFILAGYNKQMEKFFEHNQGFNSRMPYRLQFADYTDKELLQMLNSRIQKKYDGKMKVENSVLGLYARIAVRRLGRGRGQEGFGNARALENMLAKMSERQADRLRRERTCGTQPDDFLLTKEDLIGPEPSSALINSAAWKELQDLIGLKTVKESIQGLLDRIETNYMRELEEKPPIEVSLNRVFLGSPGTGKTSVGKLYGQVLADIGLLSNGEVVVKSPADFVGNVIGQSENNTKAILKAAEGKVLIIDEAYMLYSGSNSGGSSSDPYRSAVIDTIVAEVQSTPGEDRCVLLLGYKEQMEAMFQNTNPGLPRRFPLDDAFNFEDFDDSQLREILDLKLKKQGLDATAEAKDVVIAMLGRARHRPNFGNAGEVENMISHAKGSYQLRESKKPLAERSTDTIFEPQDFDANFDRSANASVNCRKLFEDVVGCEEIVDKLEGYVQTASSMRARDVDPREHIPFNFIFKGPPGTGKTTTARKMGQVFYNMGFLASADVHECSATDMMGSYVGQTGPKVINLLEKALGRVLFVDEAYRLGQGLYAKEAIDEIVDSVTKSRFLGKIIIILAGYEDDMNRLLHTNQGLSSRFSEEVVFRNMEPEHCWKLLCRSLEKTRITVEEEDRGHSHCEILDLFEELSCLPAWGNGRDIGTLSNSITSATFRAATDPTVELRVGHQQIINALRNFLVNLRARCETSDRGSMPAKPEGEAAQDLLEPASPPTNTATSTSTSIKSAPVKEIVSLSEKLQASQLSDSAQDQRDPGVSDAIWTQLHTDKAAQEQAQQRANTVIAVADEAIKSAATQEATLAKEMEFLTTAQNAADEEAKELKRRHEEARLKHLAARRAKEEAERKQKEEVRVQMKLRRMGVCVAGFVWVKQAEGYRCAGGSHFVGNEALGV